MTGLHEKSTQPEIPLLVVGFDFRIASSELREKLVTSEGDRAYLFESIKKLDDTAGILVLETCNRLEWVVSTRYPGWISEILKAWMLNRWQEAFPGMTGLPTPYEFIGKTAVVHVLRVVVGLESLAMGEAQIAGQFQNALMRSQKEKTSSTTINRLSHIAGRIAKTGYKIGFRSNYRQGIHGLVVRYMEEHFKTGLDQKTVLVAGMGDIGRRTAALIEESFGCRVQPVNRTIKDEHRGKWAPMSELSALAIGADALVVATGGSMPVINNESFKIDERPEKLLIMDIGIPRQVGEPVQNHPMVLYRNIDHLMELGRDEEKTLHMCELEREIDKELGRFVQFCRGRELSDILCRIHNGRLELTENRIPQFVDDHLADIDPNRQRKIEQALKKFIKDYSNEIFYTFHDTMEKYWSANTNGK